MSGLVLDCSITMAWCFEDQADPGADAVLASLIRNEAVVPAIWPLEVANVLAVSERKKKMTAAKSTRFLTLLNALPIRVEEQTAEQVFRDILALARAHQLSAYDAAYLELALRKGLPLASRDQAVRRAAHSLGLTLFGGD